MNLREAVKQTPYKMGAIAAALLHFVLRTWKFRKEAWVGSGGYFGIMGLLLPFLVEKKATNQTAKAFALGWRNTYVFLAIGENLYWVAKGRLEKDERPTLALGAICAAAAVLSIKAENFSSIVPVSGSTPPAEGPLALGGKKTVITRGNKMFVVNK